MIARNLSEALGTRVTHEGLRYLADSAPEVVVQVSERKFSILPLPATCRPRPGETMTIAQWVAEAKVHKGTARVGALVLLFPAALAAPDPARALLDALADAYRRRGERVQSGYATVPRLRPPERATLERLAAQVGLSEARPTPLAAMRTCVASALKTMLNPRRCAVPLLAIDEGVLTPTWHRDAHPAYALGTEAQRWELARDLLDARQDQVRNRPEVRAALRRNARAILTGDQRGALTRPKQRRLAARIQGVHPEQQRRATIRTRGPNGRPTPKMLKRLRLAGVPWPNELTRSQANALHRAIYARQCDPENRLQVHEVFRLVEMGVDPSDATNYTVAEFSARHRRPPRDLLPGEGWEESAGWSFDAELLAEADAVFASTQ